MNTKNMLRILGFLLVCLASSGCHCDTQTAEQPPPRSACDDYGSLTASLAEETIRCTGTIGPDSFQIENNQLQARFTACSEGPEQMRTARFTGLKKLLALQSFHAALPRFQECLVDRYTRWSELFKRTQLATCPKWVEQTVVGDLPPDLARRAAVQLGKMQPKLPYVRAYQGDVSKQSPRQPYRTYGPEVVRDPNKPTPLPPDLKPSPDQRFVDILVPSKTSIVYQISYPQPEPNCADAAVCAAQCAAFLPGFVLSAAGSLVVADPASWYRDNVFGASCDGPTDDPWCPPGFVHQMAVTNTGTNTVPPGDIYGNPNRSLFGEHCLRWARNPRDPHAPGLDFETDLVKECVDQDQSDCLSRCGN